MLGLFLVLPLPTILKRPWVSDQFKGIPRDTRHEACAGLVRNPIYFRKAFFLVCV